MNRWKVGDVAITRVIEAEELWDGTLLLPGATADAVKKEPGLFPAFTTEEGQFRLSIHAFILESQGKRIIVDTCVGNDKPRPIPSATTSRPASPTTWSGGPQPERSTRHLHPSARRPRGLEHDARGRAVGGDIPAGPVPGSRGTEWEHWSKTDETAVYGGRVDDSVRPVMDAGLVDAGGRRPPDHRRLWLSPRRVTRPGHTACGSPPARPKRSSRAT